MEINKVGIFLTIFITLIVGISLLSSTADQISLVDKTYTTVNESITINNVTTTELANNWVTEVSQVWIDNGSRFLLTETTNYTVGNLNSQNKATIKLTESAGFYYNNNATNVTYTYQDDNYIRGSSASQTLIKLIVVFFAIAILIVGIWGLKRLGMF